MFQALKPMLYVVKRNDNLDTIARTHGYASWKVLYFSSFNSQLRARCPNPDKIFEGTSVFLPPKAQNVVLALKQSNQLLINTKQSFLNTTDNELQSLKKSLNDVEAFGRNVDAIKDVALILADLTKIIYKGAQAIKMSGSVLDKMNKEMAKEAVQFGYTPIIEKGLEVYSEADLDNNIITVSSQIIVKSFIEMTSPSFWANTITNLMSGMPWSQAVTTKPSDVYDKCARQILNQREKFISDIDRRINENNKLIGEFSKLVDKPLPLKLLY